MRSLFFLLSLCSIGFCCTDFVLVDQKGGAVVGRSMEFAQNLESEILVVQKGSKGESLVDGKPSMTWKQKYSYLGLNALGTSLICDGVNEKGLSFGALWFPPSKYPPLSKESKTEVIALEDVGGWILGSFATIGEARKGLEKVSIYAHVIPALGEIPPLHFSIHDRSGKSIVVEFIDGKMVISNNPVGVLTNAPKFEWHLTNLSNYINLTAINVGPVKLEGSVLDPTGQGTGLLGLPGDWTPPSRFVRMAVLKEFIQKSKTTELNINLAFHLLNNVDIPYGAVQGKGGKDFDYTQWVVVKDLQNGAIHYRTYANLDIQTVNLQEEVKKGTKKIPLK